jgi:hypothetical protein
VSSITIQIGIRVTPAEDERLANALNPWFTFQIVETNAPDEYDGFDTMTIENYGPSRLVLINRDYYDWQTQRYASGGYKAAQMDDDSRLAESVIEKLWWRIECK